MSHYVVTSNSNKDSSKVSEINKDVNEEEDILFLC